MKGVRDRGSSSDGSCKSNESSDRDGRHDVDHGQRKSGTQIRSYCTKR